MFMLSKKIIIISLFVFVTFFSYSQSHFDNVNWKDGKIKKDKEVTLYTVKGDDGNFYKTETIVRNQSFEAKDLFDAIKDYQQYMEIFQKIRVFQPVGQTEKGEIIYVDADFSPLKHRIYYIVLWTQIIDNTYIIEWEPYFGTDLIKPLEKNQKLVKKVYGKWIFTNNEDGSVYVSNEYHNNWDYSGIPQAMATPGEQNVSINNIRFLIDYVGKKGIR